MSTSKSLATPAICASAFLVFCAGAHMANKKFIPKEEDYGTLDAPVAESPATMEAFREKLAAFKAATEKMAPRAAQVALIDTPGKFASPENQAYLADYYKEKVALEAMAAEFSVNALQNKTLSESDFGELAADFNALALKYVDKNILLPEGLAKRQLRECQAVSPDASATRACMIKAQSDVDGSLNNRFALFFCSVIATGAAAVGFGMGAHSRIKPLSDRKERNTLVSLKDFVP